MVGKRKNSYDDAVSECNSMLPDDQDAGPYTNLPPEAMKFEDKASEQTSPYAERRLERRQKSRERLRMRQESHVTETSVVETYKEVSRKETFVEIKVNSSSDIKSTRIDDILKAVTTHREPPPPPPPARTELRDIKQILATHRSRPRRPANEKPDENGVTSPISPTPKSPDPLKSPVGSKRKEERPKKKEDAPPKVMAAPVRPVKAEPAPRTPPNTLVSPDGDEGDNILEKLRKRKERLLNNKPGCCSHERCKPDGDNPDQGPRLHTWPCLLSRYNTPETPPPPSKVEPDAPPKTPVTPIYLPDDLERQTLDSLEGMTSVIIKERDHARKERNDAREKCASILNEYDGRRQAWQNQLNVVKIRLEHYARRHDKLRNDITKQQEKFDIERSRMKERHATQIEGLFGDLFSKIRADDKYVGTSPGLDEVNYKLQAFMELWKGLAHDVDDLYDKEHYCLRLCETVKSLQEQIKHQNKIISGLAKGVPVNTIPASPSDELPPPNINVTIDHHKWEIVPPNRHSPFPTKDQKLPEFEEFKLLDRLLPEEDGLSCEDILQQFAPIEETLNSFTLSLDRPKKKREVATSPPPQNDNPPISVEVRDVPCKKAAPFLPKPSININKSIYEYNKQPDLPIKLDPKEIANSPRNKQREPETPMVEIDTAPVVKALRPFSGPSMFDDPIKHAPLETTLDDPASTLPKETTIDGPAPKPKKKKKKKSKPAAEPVPEPAVVQAERVPVAEVEEAKPVQSFRPSSPSPTPSFRRRRASMESAKDFSIMGDPDLDSPSSPPPLPKTPKETTLDDPAVTSPSSSVASPAPSANGPEKKKKWKPSIPIFNKKLPKSQPREDRPVPVQDRAPSTSNSESKKPPSDEAPGQVVAPQAPRQKRAKSLPRFRDPSLPRNMASANMKRALSNPRLKKGPGSEYNSDDSDDSDSDIRSLIESVYMPLHLTPVSRSGSKKNVADDAKSEASSFARRNKMPGSMGWLDSNKPNSSDESSDDDDYTTSESDDDSDSGSSSEEDGEESSESEADKSSIGDEEEQEEEVEEEEDDEDGLLDNRNSMLSSIMKDFDDDSKDWLNSSFASSQQPQPGQRGEILI